MAISTKDRNYLAIAGIGQTVTLDNGDVIKVEWWGSCGDCYLKMIGDCDPAKRLFSEQTCNSEATPGISKVFRKLIKGK